MATAKMAEEAAKNIVCEREQSDKIWREPSTLGVIVTSCEDSCYFGLLSKSSET